MKTLIVYFMMSPGVWDSWELEFKNMKTCHEVEHSLIRIYPTVRWDYFKNIYRDGSDGPHIFFISCT